jgi:catechol 2,3-dioxygenase-like lactoylglutathione lyase family enzyme
MSSALTEPGTATETRPGDRRPPARLHHSNFYTSDLEATRHFYEDVAGLPLKVFWIEPVPKGQGTEQIGHAFFGLADGGLMAFMQYTEAAVQATQVSTQQPDSVHIALKVDDGQQKETRERVEAEGYEEMYQMEAERAHEMMRRFLAGDRTPTIPEKL